MVWSESDGLPGVIVDRYGDHLVLQTLTLAMDQRIELIVEALKFAEIQRLWQALLIRYTAMLQDNNLTR